MLRRGRFRLWVVVATSGIGQPSRIIVRVGRNAGAGWRVLVIDAEPQVLGLGRAPHQRLPHGHGGVTRMPEALRDYIRKFAIACVLRNGSRHLLTARGRTCTTLSSRAS